MRQSWKLALAGIIALSMAGCANEENRDGGGGGDKELNRDSRTYENSNPISREQENREGALPMQAEPESGTAVNGKTGDERVQNPKTDVIARGGVPTSKVDVNSATMEELHAVPGISHNMAEAIINNRPYRNQQDLIKRVPNLDKRFLSSFDQYLTIGPAREKAAPTGDN
jgi:DNA uptake protein ComE-like DNA-binding protein